VNFLVIKFNLGGLYIILLCTYDKSLEMGSQLMVRDDINNLKVIIIQLVDVFVFVYIFPMELINQHFK